MSFWILFRVCCCGPSRLDRLREVIPFRLSILLIALGLMMGGWGCNSAGEADQQSSKQSSKQSTHKDPQKKEAQEATPVEVTRVTRGEIKLKLRAVSVIEPQERASIRSLVSGVITELKVEEGDRVKQGQLLARISRPGASSLLGQAYSSAQKARRDLERVQKLVKRGLAPREEQTQAEFQRDQRALELSRLRSEAQYERIKSPISGVVVQRVVYQGETVSPGQLMLEIMDLSEVYAPLHLPDRWAHRIKLNLSARLLDREGGVLETHAYVSRVSPIINAETGTFKVWVSPPKSPHNHRVKKKRRHTQKDQKKTAQNQRAKLKPGLFVTAEITLDQHHNALLIPREAVMYREGTPFVVRTQGERARITKVKLGFTEKAHVEVIEPLKEGERIVSFGQRGLEEGRSLKLIEPSLP